MARGTDSDSRIRYLDGDAERRALIADIQAVRRQVIAFAQGVPQEAWYEPRYHGWSLAAMLAHLHLMDNLTLMQIKLALIGIGIGFTAGQLNRFNDACARWFQRRLVTTTLRGIEKNERRIADFILNLPIDRFTRTVYFPPTGERLTVERAMQQYFLFHWQHHLATLTEPPGGDDHDDFFYEPPPSGVGLV
ncbi:MAG: DinB family protein [Anaerolineae bacterium]|nr:DinB family protein [Anaerolineae bacterium]NUQ04798.1 hypothetical protein [Anaerolineae bacterium]